MAPQVANRGFFRRKKTYLVFFLPVIIFTLVVALPTNLRMHFETPSSTEIAELDVKESPADPEVAIKSDGFSETGMEEVGEGLMEQLAEKRGGDPEQDAVERRALFPNENENEGDAVVDFIRGAEPEVEKREKQPLQLSNLALDPSDIVTDLPVATEKWKPTHVFVISMSRDTEKLREIDAKLDSVGMKYTLIFAPDSTAIDLEKYLAILPEDRMSASRGSQMAPNEIDELLAHLELWAHVVAHQLRYSIVLEEDAVLKDSFKEDLERSLKQLNLLRVEHTGYFFDVCMLGRDFYTNTEAQLTANIIEARSSAGAHAYLLTLAGAFRLLENIRLDDPLNEAMWQVHQLYWLALNPPAVETTMYKCENPPCRQMPLPGSSPSKSTRGLLGYHATLDLTRKGECGGTAWECLGDRVRDWVKKRRKHRAPWPAVPLELEDWPVYVMNMDRETRRMEDLKKRLAEHGFGKVQRAVAVDMGSTDLATFNHLIAKDKVSVTRAGWNAAAKFLSKGDIGCALSHYM
jgi:GR25 family glycosyltransferase involved in LPS biosynthesis